MELTDRKKQILKVVIEDTSTPPNRWGSRPLPPRWAARSAPPPSAMNWRIWWSWAIWSSPTPLPDGFPPPRGYRLYVNELMEQQRLSLAETERINQSLQMKMEELDRVISQAGKAISAFVNYPAYITAAGRKKDRCPPLRAAARR